MAHVTTTRRLKFIEDYKRELETIGVQWGTCFCGCGRTTTVADGTDYKNGALLNFPRRFILGHGNKIPGPEYILEDQGYTTLCWTWRLGSTQSERGGRYGVARRNPGDKVPISSHRLMWERHRGPVPTELEIDHRCLNTLCCNPDHLQLVPHEENVRLGVADRGLLKMTKADAIEAIRMRCSGISFRKIGERFNVRGDYIQAICYGRKWKGIVPVEELPKTRKHSRG